MAFGAGLPFALAFAPYGYWPVGLAALLVLYWMIGGATSRREAVTRCFLFGVGKFGAGAYWVFVSLHAYAEMDLVLAATMFMLFVAAVSGLFSLVAFFAVETRNATMSALVFAVGLCIAELALSLPWALSFPWLHLGYALIDTPLSFWAPLGGVWAVSFAGAVSVVAAAEAIRRSWVPLGVAVLVWLPGVLFPVKSQETGDAVPVAVVQGNVRLEEKWRPGAWKGLLDGMCAFPTGSRRWT